MQRCCVMKAASGGRGEQLLDATSRHVRARSPLGAERTRSAACGQLLSYTSSLRRGQVRRLLGLSYYSG
jgi:hypothetical protein